MEVLLVPVDCRRVDSSNADWTVKGCVSDKGDLTTEESISIENDLRFWDMKGEFKGIGFPARTRGEFKKPV